MKIEQILKVTNGKLLNGTKEAICQNFSTDTRKIKNGDTFIALKGEKYDGNEFVKNAIDKGAKTCIISDENSIEEVDVKDINIICVNDTVEALQKIATYKRNMYNIPVIAVTGSVGKTSTKDIIASVMSQKYKVLKTEGNLNNHIGLPLTILKLKDEEALVIEMGMNHFGEIRTLTNIARPTVAVITNIGTSHIGNLGSKENILKAKTEILEGLVDNKVIINNDDELLCKWAKDNKDKYNIITYGIENKNSNFVAEKIETLEDKSHYYIKNRKVTVPVAGKHFILNSLCSIAVGSLYDIEMDNIIKEIESFKLTKSRMEIVKSKSGSTIINDTYNANYDSMSAALRYLEEIKNKRKIAVLGDMLELGELSKEIHSKIGKEIKNVDVLITVGTDAKEIFENAKVRQKFYFENNEEALKKIIEIDKGEDVILFKASNAMKFIEMVDKLKK